MSEKNSQKEPLYKILVLGDWAVGKSCFLKRYTDNIFTDIHLSTIGIEFQIKYLTLENGKKIKLQLWDTAGEERYHSITKSFLKGTKGIILIYDITSKKTFEGIQDWVKDIKNQISSRACVALVGNKSDLEDKRQVSKEQGENIASELGFPFYETSAKDGTNINECFFDLATQLDENYSQNSLDNTSQLNNKKGNSSGCC